MAVKFYESRQKLCEWQFYKLISITNDAFLYEQFQIQQYWLVKQKPSIKHALKDIYLMTITC